MIHSFIARRLLHSCTLLSVVMLCVLLAGCDLFSASHADTHGAVSPSPSVASQPSVNVGGVATADGLQLNTRISCDVFAVLKPHAPTYSEDELAAIKTFLSQHTRPDIFGPGIVYDPTAQLPATLAYDPGGIQCSGDYELTNTSSDLIQINQIGFQNLRAPGHYTHEYHLIDACPYLTDCGCGGCGAQEACAYAADVHLQLNNQPLALSDIGFANNGNGVVPIPPGVPNCPNVINLQSGGVVHIEMTYHPPDGPSGSWFRGVPAVSVTTAKGTRTITYPTLIHDLVFTPLDSHGLPSPNTCVTQQGNTFVPVTSFAKVPDASKSSFDPYYIPRCV